MTEIWEALRAPFPPAVVSWRVGATNADKASGKPPTKGIALAYIDARDVMDRLDTVVGPENWECRYPHAGQKTVCEIGIRCDGNWVYKADGAGDTDTEAEKGALSDAFKRAAVRFGIGRYLYSLDSPWVELEQRGRSYVIKQSELAKLRSLLPAPFPVNSNGTKAQPLKRDEARKIFAELRDELLTLNTEQEVMAWERESKVRIDLLGDWKIHIDNAVAEHKQEIAKRKEAAEQKEQAA